MKPIGGVLGLVHSTLYTASTMKLLMPEKGRRWYISERLEGGLLLATALLSGALGTLEAIVGQAPWWQAVWLWVVTAVAAAAGLVKLLRLAEKAKQSDKRDGQKIEVTAYLYAIHAAVLARRGLGYQDHFNRIRVTVHGIDHDGQQLVQLVDYVGDTDPKRRRRRGRRTAIGWGFVGHAVRNGGTPAAYRVPSSQEQYETDMMTTYGMEKGDTAKLKQDVKALLAVPLPPTDPVAVLYMDTDLDIVFDRADAYFVMNACAGLTRYATLQEG